MPSFYLPQELEFGKEYSLEGEEFHHASHVFRIAKGQIVSITNGNGVLARAEVTEVQKKKLVLLVTERHEYQPSPPPMRVAFSLLRNKNDEWLVEKLTELGVKEFYPMTTENTVRQPSENTHEKFLKTAIAAIKQCDCPFLPMFHPITPIKEVLGLLKNTHIEPCIAAENEKQQTLSTVIQDTTMPICLIIGPEGGFSLKEFQWFAEQEIKRFSIGNQILRAETAAVAAVSQLLALYLQQNPSYR